MVTTETGKAVRVGWWIMAALAVLPGVGCNRPSSWLDIVDHRDDGPSASYREPFQEAYYEIKEDGQIRVALRRQSALSGDGNDPIIQVLELGSFWQSVPQRSVADAGQINATMRYAILAGHSAERSSFYEGAGSVFFRPAPIGDDMIGRIENAYLNPQSGGNAEMPLFDHVELAGRFRAKHDPREVRRLSQFVEERVKELTPREPGAKERSGQG